MDIYDELNLSYSGDISNESWIRDYYSVDSSHHQIYPQLVCFPKDKADIVTSLNCASKNGLSVACRGAGTSLLGQSLSDGLILDFTKYMNKILDLDIQFETVTVQPGVVKGVLDKELKKQNKFLPPDPASSNYCTIGGMVSNNSSGPHGLGYGSILKYLDRVDIIYSSGEEGFAENGNCDGRLKEILSPLISIQNKLASYYPDVSKNSCGYRLDSVFTPEFKPQNIFAASEGTLSIFDSLRLRIMDIPLFSSLFLVYFSNVSSACLYTKKILTTVPVAIELLDNSVMDSSIKSNILNENGCLLFIEYFYQFRDKISTIHDLLKRMIYPDGKIVEHAHDTASINKLWHSRKNALNMAIKNTVGNRRQFTIIEDTAVSIDLLHEYVIYLLSLYKKYDLQYVIYGHVGNGNLHTRPILDNYNSSEDHLHSKQERILQNITYETFKKIFEYHGTITAEHGDGISRTPFIKNVYNSFVYSYFSYIKKSLDPLNLLNPGKKVL